MVMLGWEYQWGALKQMLTPSDTETFVPRRIREAVAKVKICEAVVWLPSMLMEPGPMPGPSPESTGNLNRK